MSKINLSSRCVHQLFEEQVERTPDALAVVGENEGLSYSELSIRSNRMANHLRSLGIGIEVAVGIYCRRNTGMVVGVLAILKAGGVYVPLDARLPGDRLKAMIQDSQCRVIVAERRLVGSLPADVSVILVDDENAFIDCSGDNLVCNGDMARNAAAYMLYTSGSTGKPKGVVVEHGQILNYIEGVNRRAKFSPSPSFAMVQPLAVDSSVTVLYSSLTQGGCLHLISEEMATDPVALGTYFERAGIDCLKIAPSHLSALQTCSEPHRLLPRSRLIVGGEASRRDWLLAIQAMARECVIFNHYGPTETTVGVLMHRVDATGTGSVGETVPIGRPMANVRAYVLDASLRLLPKGVPGELYIGGGSVARGYWKRPDLTGARFVADPYAADGTRMYRTGDLARWREDGELEFLGRIDDQVKIRGFRIELGEIEATLREHELVTDALVIVRGEEEEKRLLAYVTSSKGAESQTELWDSFIDEWKMIYESPGDFEVEGWQSSYTGRPIAAEEMRIWLEETVKSLRRLQARKILEIGCGSDAVVKRLAAHCESYVGLDFSEHALSRLKRYISARTDMKHVELHQGVAHELSFLPEDSVDLVILNSVVQYFPDVDYLLKVLQVAARVTRRGGHIYLGDVRSLPLWRAFHLSVQMHKAADNLPLEELRLRVHYAQRNEKELLIDPGFFAELVRRLEKVGWAECSLKAGGYDNELSRFRYDVVVNIGEKKGPIEPESWLKWDEEGRWREELERRVVEEPGKTIGVEGVVDARVSQWVEAVRLLDSGTGELRTVGDLRAASAEHKGEHLDAVLQLAERLGVELSRGRYGKDGIYDLVVNPQWRDQEVVGMAEQEMGRVYNRRYGNDPGRVMEERALGQSLPEYLRQKLPDYMVPAAVTVLPFWPLTPHGKLDRNALPEPEIEQAGVDEHEAPEGETERTLATIWEELLQVERVGRKDNFFALGGHSLLATRLVSRVRARMGLEMTIAALFKSPTVEGLSKRLQKGRVWRVERQKRPERIPLSYAQQRLWFIDWMEGASAEYNMPGALRLRGKLDRDALQCAINTVVERHESLRTHFGQVDGEPIQIIAPKMEVALPLVDLSALAGKEQEDAMRRARREEATKPFDLARGPVLRMKLLKLRDEEHILLRTMHHIVSDGWSTGVMNRELGILYEAYREGRENPLKPLEVQYADFALWQRKWLSEGALEEGLRYWKEELTGVKGDLQLPKDRVRPARQTFAADMCTASLPSREAVLLKRLGERNGATLFMTLLGVFGVLLSRYSGQEDIVVGAPIANRQDAALEELIGFFVNSLVMRIRVKGEESFRELLGKVKRAALDAYRHQDVPFERVVEELSPERSFNVTPLFQVTFAVQNAPSAAPDLAGLKVEPVSSEEVRVRYDLEVHVWEENGEGIGILWLYNRDLFDRWRMAQMLGHYLELVRGVLEEESRRVDSLPLLGEEERRRIVYEWNTTRAEYPTEKCVHELFEEQVEKTPEAVAVEYEDQRWTYGELNRRANQLAHYLRRLGVKPEERVGICMERSAELIVALLAVLKAGGAYVPLDPAYPEERLRFMLEDNVPVVLLTQALMKERLWSLTATPPLVDLMDARPWSNEPESNLEAGGVGVSAGNLAYVIYTSGSTGQPKGVMVSHRNIVNSTLARKVTYGALERFLLVSSISFDSSVAVIFGSLTNAGTLIIVAGDVLRDPCRLNDYIEDLQVKSLLCVPSLYKQILECAIPANKKQLSRVIVAGEPCRSNLVEESGRRAPETALFNEYGPTECTVWASLYACNHRSGQKTVPIGRPIANTSIYILDKQGDPVPVGAVGELYIGGAGVARGYWIRPELTAERFVADPFAEKAGARMYKTGDLGRWMPDGNIEFVGRNDDQVKLRGYRIELGEIEVRLGEHHGVREAVVTALEDVPAEKQLVAYYTAREQTGGKMGENGLGPEQLRAHLALRLPEYMVPAAYVRLDVLPLTPNGKLDRRALPAPNRDAYTVRRYEAPVGDTETIIAGIWAELLHLKQVGRHENFFELGGHSLLAVTLIERMRCVGLRVDVRALFTTPTPAGLAMATEEIEITL